MRSIIFIMLVGLSLLSEGHSDSVAMPPEMAAEGTYEKVETDSDSDEEPSQPQPKPQPPKQMLSECLMRAIKNCPHNFLNALFRNVCAYRKEPEKYSKQLIETVKKCLEPYGCSMNQLMGIDLSKTTDTAQRLSACVENVLNKPGLYKNVVDAVCILFNNTLTNQCLENIKAVLKTTTDEALRSKLMSSISNLACDQKKKQLDVSKVNMTLESLTCPILSSLQAGPSTGVTSTVDTFVMTKMGRLVEKILSDKGIGGIVGKIACGALNTASEAVEDLTSDLFGSGGF